MQDPDYWKFSNEDGKLERCDMRQFKADLDAAIQYQKQLEEDQTMSKLQHTATPWAVKSKTSIMAGERGIATTHLHYGDQPEAIQEDEANAAFIVRAVNSHEKLVAALQNIEVKSRNSINDLADAGDNQIEIGDIARAALAEAGMGGNLPEAVTTPDDDSQLIWHR